MLKYEDAATLTGVSTTFDGGRWVVVGQSYMTDRFIRDPADCGAGTLPRGIDQTGTASGCASFWTPLRCRRIR